MANRLFAVVKKFPASDAEFDRWWQFGTVWYMIVLRVKKAWLFVPQGRA
jgi:hypothetical protein